jgi:hypothetical protein
MSLLVQYKYSNYMVEQAIQEQAIQDSILFGMGAPLLGTAWQSNAGRQILKGQTLAVTSKLHHFLAEQGLRCSNCVSPLPAASALPNPAARLPSLNTKYRCALSLQIV